MPAADAPLLDVVVLAGVTLYAVLFGAAAALPSRRPGSGAGEDPPRAPDARHGFALRFACLAAGLLAALASLSLITNPFGLYPTRLFEPIVLHSRRDKMALLSKATPAPQVIVLGGSSSFTMPPPEIERLTGRPAFNASVHGGTSRDYLGLLRFVVDRGRAPALVIMPLSVELFRPDVQTGFEPYDPLRAYVGDAPDHPLGALSLLLAPVQLEAAVKLLALERRGRPAPHYRFDADGCGHLPPGPPSPEQVDRYVGDMQRSGGLQYADPSPRMLAYLGQALDLCRERRIQVIVLFPPYHPVALAVFRRETRLTPLREALDGFLEPWRRDGTVRAVHDFTDVASFGGSAAMFHDPLHPTGEAATLMLRVMLARP